MKPFQTMPCRVKSYEAALNGYEKTDTYLIAYNDICNGGENILTPAGYTDYVGSFLYIPFFSDLMNIDIDTITILFYSLYGILCILISVIGLFKFYNTKPALIHGTISIL